MLHELGMRVHEFCCDDDGWRWVNKLRRQRREVGWQCDSCTSVVTQFVDEIEITFQCWNGETVVLSLLTRSGSCAIRNVSVRVCVFLSVVSDHSIETSASRR